MTIAELLLPQKPSYIGLMVRSAIVILFQSLFRISPFNFRSNVKPSITDMLIMSPLLIGTYSLLVGYAFQAVIRIGAVADDETPFHEKLIAIILLAAVVLLCIYVSLTTPPGTPWYLE